MVMKRFKRRAGDAMEGLGWKARTKQIPSNIVWQEICGDLNFRDLGKFHWLGCELITRPRGWRTRVRSTPKADVGSEHRHLSRSAGSGNPESQIGTRPLAALSLAGYAMCRSGDAPANRPATARRRVRTFCEWPDRPDSSIRFARPIAGKSAKRRLVRVGSAAKRAFRG
jgi:hypothetical protein